MSHEIMYEKHLAGVKSLNEISETYKVLTSFNYLKDLINTINIPEEIANEIPE